MKRLTAYLVMSLLALPVFAQQPARPAPTTPTTLLSSVVFTAEDGLLSINLLDHVFVGYSIAESEAFTPHGGGELAINALALNIEPMPAVNLSVGMDCKWQFFSTRDSRFYLDLQKIPQVTEWPLKKDKTASGQSQTGGSGTNTGTGANTGTNNGTDTNTNTGAGTGQTETPPQTQEPEPEFTLPDETKIGKQRSSLHTFSLSIPVMATVHINDYFWISAGAEANLNLTSWTNFTLETGDVTESSAVSDGQVRPFTFDFVGMVGFKDAAVFFKYYPTTSRIVPDGGVQFDYCSLGVTLFL
jgi:hypothetical protein